MKPTDIDWSKAPEGATHYVENSICVWGKRIGDDWYYFNPIDGSWKHLQSDGDNRIKRSPSNMPVIPRPTSQPTDNPEWDGEGLPPVGCECEINPHGEWFRATVRGYSSHKFLAEISAGQIDEDGDEIAGEHAYWTQGTGFRPLKTQAEREREELSDLLETHVYGSKKDFKIAADAILARYELKERNQ